MNVETLVAMLAKYPRDMEVAIDDGGIYMVIDYVEPEGSLLLIGNEDGFHYQQ